MSAWRKYIILHIKKDEKPPFHVAEYWGGGGETRGLRKTQTDDVLHHGEVDVGEELMLF